MHMLVHHRSLVKSWNTLRAREVTALGREVLGGNGILTDWNVAKASGGCMLYHSTSVC